MNKWWLRGALLSSFVVLAACSSSKPSTSNNNTGGQNAGGQNNGGTGNTGGSTGATLRGGRPVAIAIAWPAACHRSSALKLAALTHLSLPSRVSSRSVLRPGH